MKGKKGTFLPTLQIVIRNNNMLNCQRVTFEETDLKRASAPQLVIIMDELHDKEQGKNKL